MKKSRLHNEKGFTLIELMATLAILALIVLIAVPAIGNIISNADESAEAHSIDLIEKAGSLADVGGLAHDDAANERYNISTLIDNGYLDLDAGSELAGATAYVERVGDTGNTYEYYGTGGSDESGSSHLVTPPDSDFEVVLYAEDVNMTPQSLVEMFESGKENYENGGPPGMDEATRQLELMRIDMVIANGGYGIIIEDYNGSELSINIPETINGLPVWGIENAVFDYMINVRVPRNVFDAAGRPNTSINSFEVYAGSYSEFVYGREGILPDGVLKIID